MTDDPFKDLRSKLTLAQSFPDLSLSSKEARAQAVIDGFVEAWQPLFDYLSAVSAQEEFRPRGKVLKASVDYKEDSFSKRIYMSIAFCDPDEDMGVHIEPQVRFSCGLIEGANSEISQALFTDSDESFFSKVTKEDRQQAVYYMMRVLVADNYYDSTEKFKFTPYDFEPCKVFLNKWLATQIATDLGAGKPETGTSRQFRFD